MHKLLHPRHQANLIGHEQAENDILQSAESGRIPHAWLIVGEEGIGKATLAYRFARYMLAERKNSETLDCDLSLPSAKLIASSSHPDLLVLERAFDEKKGRTQNSILIDDVRKIAPFLRLTASQGEWRIVIIDGAGTLNRGGQNALLKILEEPPPQSLILLTARSAANLLPTIRSRCRVIRLDGLSDKNLHHLAQGQGLAEHPSLDLIINMAGGSAARLFRFAANDAHILFKAWCDFLKNPENHRARLSLAEGWTGKDSQELFLTVQDMIFLWLQRLIDAKARGCVLNPLSSEEKPLIQGLYSTLPLDKLMQLWENLSQQMQEIETRNLDAKPVFLNILEDVAQTLRPNA